MLKLWVTMRVTASDWNFSRLCNSCISIWSHVVIVHNSSHTCRLEFRITIRLTSCTSNVKQPEEGQIGINSSKSFFFFFYNSLWRAFPAAPHLQKLLEGRVACLIAVQMLGRLNGSGSTICWDLFTLWEASKMVATYYGRKVCSYVECFLIW